MWGRGSVKAKVCAPGTGRYNGGPGELAASMEELHIVSYEVHVLGPSGWSMHGRYPQEDRQAALTEAKFLESEMAAATKVVRSDYQPRSNTEQRADVYASRLTSGEHGQQKSKPAPVAKPPVRPRVRRHRRHVVHRRDMTPAAVLMRLGGIIGASAFIATLITVSGGLFLDRLALFHTPDPQGGKGLMSGIFLTAFLLVALPWIVSFARQIEVIGFTLPGPPTTTPKRSPKRPAAGSAPDLGGVTGDSLNPAEPVPIPEAEPLVDPEEDPEDEEPVDDAPVEGAPMPEPAEAAAAAVFPEPPDQPQESAERLLHHRRSLLRFLRSLVTDLRESRPNLNSFERYGLGLLLAGAVDQVVDHGGLGPRGRAQLVREALGILGRQPGLIEAVEDGLHDTLRDPRSARIMQAGRDSMRHFLAGSRDFLAAVLTALESWNRPGGATGSGVVAAMLVQAWPDEGVALDSAYDAARAHGGAVIGSVDGIALLFPGIARALQAALDLLPNLPAAARIGIEAAEAATEDEAVRAVGAARRLCHTARPGQILCSTAVRALGGRAEVRFESVAAPDDAGLSVYALLPAAAGPVNTTDPSPSSAAAALPLASDPAG